MFVVEQVPIHSSGVDSEEQQHQAEELRELREKVAVVSSRCAELDEANRAWQMYQQRQVDNFRSKLLECVPVDADRSFDEMAQEIVDQIVREREEFRERYAALETANDELLTGNLYDNRLLHG